LLLVTNLSKARRGEGGARITDLVERRHKSRSCEVDPPFWRRTRGQCNVRFRPEQCPLGRILDEPLEAKAADLVLIVLR
jgi:hypothetical protein